MFSSTTLDVALGLVFTFMTISLITSAIVEAISSVIKLRSRTLFKGVKQLVNDDQFRSLARQLYQHVAVNPRGSAAAPKRNWPAYIDSKQFANAFMDVTGLTAAVAEPMANGPVAALKDAAGKIADEQIKTFLLGAIDRSAGDLDRIRTEVATWFDTAMDRVSGAYKRWTQLISFLLALLVAVAVNIDTVRIARTLWAQPIIAENLKIGHGIPQAREALTEMDQDLPVGWPNGHLFHKLMNKGTIANPIVEEAGLHGWPDWGPAWAGWLLTAFATLFGAPFWFDALQSIVRLKGSGPSPEERKSGRAAAS